MPTGDSPDPSPARLIDFDPFAADDRHFAQLNTVVHGRTAGRLAVAYRYDIPYTGRPPAGTVYACPAVMLHRRGRRQLALGPNAAAAAAPTPVRDGLVSLIPAGWAVCPNYQDKCQGLVVALPPRLLAEAARELGTAPTFAAAAGIEDVVLEGLCETLWRAMDRSRNLTDALARAAAVHVLDRYAARTPVVPAWLRRATEYGDAHLGGPLSVDDLAAAAGMSRSHFSRRFAAAVGRSPHAWLLARRVDRAADLIRREPDAPLAEVAAEAGFCDQSHLTAQFRRHLGRTPAAFRAELGAKSPSA